MILILSESKKSSVSCCSFSIVSSCSSTTLSLAKETPFLLLASSHACAKAGATDLTSTEREARGTVSRTSGVLKPWKKDTCV